MSVGLIKDVFGPTTAFLTAAAFIAASAVVFLVVRARTPVPDPAATPGD